jgi:outer membrane protein assembly factor BamB
VVALDAASGDTLWTFDGPQAEFIEWSGAAVAEDALYIGHSAGVMFALDKATGRELWRTEVEDWATADPVLVQDDSGALLIFGVGAHALQAPEDAPRTVYALDPATGEVRWTLPVSGLMHNGAAVMDATVFVTTATGVLVMLR